MKGQDEGDTMERETKGKRKGNESGTHGTNSAADDDVRGVDSGVAEDVT